MIIAIDGPAGSGKSTVAKMVAKRLGYLYVDTGAMYRALTLKAIKNNIDLNDQEALIRLADTSEINLKMSGGCLQVFLDGVDVTTAIRSQDLTRKVSFVAQCVAVRLRMVKLQRELCKDTASILEGRDIGTVVFPDAEWKFYLDAEFTERVRRRHKELVKMGQKVSLQRVKEDVQSRDEKDKARKVAPLKRAQDALCIDTTNMSIDEVVERIIDTVTKK